MKALASVAVMALSASLGWADALTNAAALWKFDGASSGYVTNANQIIDSSGNGHNATGMTNPGNTNISWATVPLTGPGGAGTLDPFGMSGRGLELQPSVVTAGTTDVVSSVGFTVANFSATGSATIATRFLWDGYISNDGDAQMAWLYRNGFTTSNGWMFGMQGSELRLFQAGSGFNTFGAVGMTMQTGIWYDAVAVLTENGESGGVGDSVAFYIFPEGGSLFYTNRTGTLTTQSTTFSQIGNETFGVGNQNQRKSFDGSIDYIAVWDRALSQEEVLALIIPEPSSMVLLALGGLVFVVRGRSREHRLRIEKRLRRKGST